MARPLIATDVPGCREVVDDVVNGYFCNPADSGSLASLMKKFAELPIDFFFSSRRRQTSFKCDWSSDVCSSDLVPAAGDGVPDRDQGVPGTDRDHRGRG